ncbi:MAG: serine hydrolase, partial [Candidatus Gracilibacteria bacterium]|jgi:D-alanyl-D-alanine carboxypeptidase|nr:serine hydrolase [Candidatus Gracilibacteria bacterium]
MDKSSNAVLFGKDIHTRRPIASLTKVMTAILILENHDLDEVLQVDREATKVEGKKAWLLANEEFTVRDLMQMLLIHSANDSAVALAIYDSGSVDEFVVKMNLRAKELGLKDTQFKNPHGLDEEGHYASAYDMGLMAGFLLNEKSGFVRETVGTKELVKISRNIRKRHFIRNTNELLFERGSKFIGIKTGTTDEAGQCLISLYQDGGKELIVVVLHSDQRFTETKEIVKEIVMR